MRRTSSAALLLGASLAAAPAGAQPADRSCVDVQIGSDRSYACLNRQLEALVPARPPAPTIGPLRADTAPAPAAGTFDQAATRQLLGTSFGHSVVPQRVRPVYPTPLIPPRGH